MRATFAGRTRAAGLQRASATRPRPCSRTSSRALEGAEAARGFASGMAAISGGRAEPGAERRPLVCVRHVYPDAYRFFEVLLPRMGVAVDYRRRPRPRRHGARAAGARVLYLESPTSWVFEVQDLARLTALARARRRRSRSSTTAGPARSSSARSRTASTSSLHSASKYLGGHSDTVAGVVAGSAELIGRINRIVLPYLGAKLAPFEGWLLVRGLRTLRAADARHHERSAIAVADAPARAPRDRARVLHPALDGTVDGAAAHRQLRPVQPRARRRASTSRASATRCGCSSSASAGAATRASSSRPRSVHEQAAAGPNSAIDFGVGPRTVRLHVGLEATQDLIDDLTPGAGGARRDCEATEQGGSA